MYMYLYICKYFIVIGFVSFSFVKKPEKEPKSEPEPEPEPEPEQEPEPKVKEVVQFSRVALTTKCFHFFTKTAYIVFQALILYHMYSFVIVNFCNLSYRF